MVKIKQKKQLNLPQLIEWVWDNNIKNERYKYSDRHPFEYVWINGNSDVEFDDDVCISKNDTFTVEVEEEIDEDTELPKAIVMYEDEDCNMFENRCVNWFSKNFIKAIYLINDDLTMTLIWTKEKGLVK